MSAVPRPRPASFSLRPPHVGAMVAAAAYAAAAFAVYQLVAPALGSEAAAPQAEAAPVTPATTALGSLGPDGLTLRALASRAQTSTYVVEGTGGAQGTGFLAWVRPRNGESYFLTARAVVAGMLTEGAREAYVKRGNRFWPAEIVRDDQNTGLALLRVETVLDRPLWPTPPERSKPAVGERAVVVPGGGEATFGEGAFSAESGRFFLRTSGERIHLGAPVVAGDGRVAGVVVELHPNGEAQVAPLGAACRKLRFYC